MDSEKFKALRIKNGLRQEDVAQAVNISRVAVTNWELGLSSPKTDLLPALATILNCSIDDLF